MSAPGELSDGKVAAIGAAAGGAVFAVLFATWLKTNMDQIQARTAPTGRSVAEMAVRSYMAERVGLTDEKLRMIRDTVQRFRQMGHPT